MRRVRGIAAAICIFIEIFQAVSFVLAVAIFQPSLVHYAHYFDYTSWVAFVALVITVFLQLPHGWLRVVVAVLTFYFLPIAIALLNLRYNYLLPGMWVFIALPIVIVGGHLIRAAIAWFIYRWGIRQGYDLSVAAGADPTPQAN
jgi:hypothetical protein